MNFALSNFAYQKAIAKIGATWGWQMSGMAVIFA
jgi:hypothetical protein